MSQRPIPSGRPARYSRPTQIRMPPAQLKVCPECAGPLARASGCVNCTQCGWGRCG